MGTNFYMMTQNKEVCDKYFGYDYELTDRPDWGYSIHIAKTSGGWLPLFQAHNCFKSVKELEEVYKTGHFCFYDEYGTIYNWEQFKERVLEFNGGIKGVEKRERKNINHFEGPPQYEELPISHFEYDNGKYASHYFKDAEGYEFTNGDFS